ncbi:MAG: hypothetical protein NZM35_08480 [Chitinophagales bacterium]|nr:hypothetical protein [Chitinophagales bacterium]MDW8419461.1 hypothetical protein [Chitinophagales bacterium]
MEITRGQELWHSKLFRFLNSAVCFSLAFMVMAYSQWFVMALVGMLFKFDALVYYYGIRFIYHEWNRKTITFIYGAASLYPLLYGLLCLYIYDKISETKSVLSLFFVWGFIIGTASFCAQAVTGSLGAGEYNSPFYHNFAVVLAWWRMPNFVNYVLNIPALALFGYFAVNYARPVLRFSYSYSKVNKVQRRRSYFTETAILPFIPGALICLYATFPWNVWITLVYLAAIMLSLGVAWYALYYIDVMKDDILRYKSLQKPAYVLAVILVAFVIYVKYTYGEVHVGYGG